MGKNSSQLHVTSTFTPIHLSCGKGAQSLMADLCNKVGKNFPLCQQVL